MPLPVIADHFRTITGFQNIPAGRPFSVCMDFAAITPASIEDEDVGEALGRAWLAVFAADRGTSTFSTGIYDGLECTGITVYDLTGDKAPYFTGPLAGIVGNSALPPLPPDLAIVCSKRTGTRGRRGRGRFYMGGWCQNVVDEDGFVDTVVDIQAAFQDNLLVLEDLTPEPIASMVVISQVEVPTGTPYPVTSLTVDNHWDVQRRRGLA